MRRFTEAFLVFITTIVLLYVFEATVGGVLDSMYFAFTNITPTLALPTQWNTVAVKQLTYFGFLWKSIIALIIATGIYVLRVATVDTEYSRGIY